MQNETQKSSNTKVFSENFQICQIWKPKCLAVSARLSFSGIKFYAVESFSQTHNKQSFSVSRPNHLSETHKIL